MANLQSGKITSPIQRGLLQSETIGQSAVARLAGLRTLAKSETSIYHFMGETQGAYVAEGAVKPNTGLALESIQVPAVKFVKLFDYSEEALDADPNLIKTLIEHQTKSLANTFDQAVLGLVDMGTADFTTFATGTQSYELADAKGFFTLLSMAGNGNGNSILLTSKMLLALRGEYNQLGQPKHNIVSTTELYGKINDVDYAVVSDLNVPEDTFGIVGPWKARTVAALGNAEVRTNTEAGEFWFKNTTGALAEIYGGFKAIDKSEFVKFTVGASVIPDPDPVDPGFSYDNVMAPENYSSEMQTEFFYETGELRVSGTDIPSGSSLEITGDFTTNDDRIVDVNGYNSNFQGNTATFFLESAPEGVQTWNVGGVYTEGTESPVSFSTTIQISGNEMEDPMNGYVNWSEDGTLTVAIDDAMLTGSIELVGTFTISGSYSNEPIETLISPYPAVLDMSGVATFSAPSLAGSAPDGVTLFDVVGIFTAN